MVDGYKKLWLCKESDDPTANPYLEFNKLSAEHRAKKRCRISQYSPDTEFDWYTKYFNHRDEKIKDPLKWWRRHESDFPILARTAFDILGIPGMSGKVERVSS